MSKVIKRFSKFNANMQEAIYDLYSEGLLERTTFPYQGETSQGVLFEHEDQMYLIPVATITAYKSGSAVDDDDAEDSDEDIESIDVDSEDESEVEVDEE